MAVRGRPLAQLLARLGSMSDELATMADWLDGEHTGNGHSEALLTQASAQLLLTQQQLMRDLGAEERRTRRPNDD